LKEEGTWDGQRRDGGTNSTLRIKEEEKRLTLYEHDDDEYNLGSIFKIKYSFCLCELPIYRKRIYKLSSYLRENAVCLR
jgi:hypothetical protein